MCGRAAREERRATVAVWTLAGSVRDCQGREARDVHNTEVMLMTVTGTSRGGGEGGHATEAACVTVTAERRVTVNGLIPAGRARDCYGRGTWRRLQA